MERDLGPKAPRGIQGCEHQLTFQKRIATRRLVSVLFHVGLQCRSNKGLLQLRNMLGLKQATASSNWRQESPGHH